MPERGPAAGEARHWLDVYRELLDTCAALLRGGRLSEHGRRGVMARQRHYSRRLEHWQERVRTLEPAAHRA